MALEINLVPDIKNEMIKALKLRNFIFFLCIVVSAGAIVVVLIFGSIVGGQSVALNDKNNTLDQMSGTLNGYSDLGEFLTIQNQVKQLSGIASNKNLLSRTFNFLLAFEPTNGDLIEFSTINVDLISSTIRIEAQADALNEPFIDYNVLDAFKKSLNYLTYDYGKYVDKNGNEIPSYCIVENDLNGSFFAEEDGSLYAYWDIDRVGCNPADDEDEEDEDEDDVVVTNNNDEAEDNCDDGENCATPIVISGSGENKRKDHGYEYEAYGENGRGVRIWRTPRYNEWHEAGYMDLDGNIEGVPHFESECSSYTGEEKEDKSIVWTKTNDQCKLVPDGENGIEILESSNGIDENDRLVLRFEAVLTLEPEAFKFNNHHLIAFGPEGRYNVTDSYTQIEKMFTERASDL